MEMCNISEVEDLNKTITNTGETENVRICGSPVFKCVNHAKPVRGNHLDNSDYDIPSYQINQAEKNVTSGKHANETSESILPFSPILSPISDAPKINLQPPSTHTVGTVAKNLNKHCQSKVNSRRKRGGAFDGLGMTDKDISWASSMASPPPKEIPGSEFNTVERATFFPEEKFHNIQPRALFSPPLDDDFGCQPIVFTSESEDAEDEEYKSNIRLSDVCSTLKQLEFKSSLEQALEKSLEKAVNEEPCCTSPVIKLKKKSESVKKKKKGSLVVSPDTKDKYEFSTNLKALECEKLACTDSFFTGDDSFQNLSFSCLDEMCKTLMSSQNDIPVASSDKVVVSTSTVNTKQNSLKKFYSTKNSAEVYTVSSMDNLHSYVKALEEGDSCIPKGKKIDHSFSDKGIVRCDVLTKDSSKIDATKRLHSEITEENDACREKKIKKEDDKWENIEQYLSESQLFISDKEIFRTAENLEKTLASLENKDLEKSNASGSQGKGKEADGKKPECTIGELDGCSKRKCDSAEDSVSSKAAPVLQISKSQEKLSCSGKSSEVPKSGSASKECLVKTLPDALHVKLSKTGRACEENKNFIQEGEKCDSVKKQFDAVTTVMEGFSTCSGKKIQISAKALEKAKALMAQCDDSVGEFFKEDFGESSGEQKRLEKCVSGSDGPSKEERPTSFLEEKPTNSSKQTQKVILSEKPEQNSSLFKGFSTGSGKTIQVSAEALEKAKVFMMNCDRELGEKSKQTESPWIGELLDQTFEIEEKTVAGQSEKPQPSGENLEKPKPDESISLPKIEPQSFGFVTAGGNKVTISESALAKAKQRMNEWEQIKPEDSGNFDCVADSRQKSETKKPEEDQSKLSTTSGFDELDDWDEIIPSWLHVYNTSPSIASDRNDLSPQDGRSLKSEKEYIIKSPVLGSGDRFQGKGKRRKLRFEEEKKLERKTSFVAPNKNPEAKGNTKRTLNLSLDFSVPFKKTKFMEEVTDVDLDVKARRARAREEQEKRIKEKQKERILKGSLLSRKSSEKQIRWMEAVKGGSPQVHSDEVLKKFGVNEAVLQINIETALSVRLNGEDFFGSECKKNTTGIPVGDDCLLILDDENKFGVEEIKRAFLASPGVQPNLLPSGWVENHYKWIIWKLAHYERSFPQYFAGCLTPTQILVQLKYRYDREIDRNERSALKKILERDDSSAKRLVLCVCGIKKVVVGETSGYEIKLTDGWYSCSARSDPAMNKLIEEGKLPVGTKILTQGATLVNCEQGASPLEVSEDTYLKISTNSTRRVRWDTKLGFQSNPKNFPISLTSILPQAGPISRIDVIIVRTYPVLYMEKTSDGHHVTRNRRLEEKADAEYRRIQEKVMETVYNEVESELRKSMHAGKSNKNHLNNFEQNEDLSELTGTSSVPSASQEKHFSNQSDRFSREFAEKVERRLEKEKLKKRDVREFLRVKIVDFRRPDYNNPAVLSIWNPNEDLIAVLSEGKVVSVTNVTINNSTRIHKPLQINTTRQTQYNRISRIVKYPARRLTKLTEVSSSVSPAFEEVDVVGMVALIRDVSYGSRLSQVVYLTDLEMNFVGVAFWGSCKDYGWENVLKTPSIVACSNLQWKKNYTSQEVLSLYVNENSVFTENPKQNYLREEMERLKQNRPKDITDFLSKCEESLTIKLKDSKWRPNTSKNSSFNDSHSSTSRSINFFESRPAASSTPIKPFTAKANPEPQAEPSPIQKRIEKLQRYGEPPPLAPLIVRNHPKKKFVTGRGVSTARS